MNSKELIRLLKRDGWEHVATRGSHWHFKHRSKEGKVYSTPQTRFTDGYSAQRS